jgi:hypothetical protein
MVELAQFQQMLWAVNVAVGVALAVLLVVRRNYRVYPAFTFYIFLNLIQAVLLFITYSRWGFPSAALWRMGWATEGAVLFARALAVAEICRHFLSRYRGVWALAWRILLVCAALVLFYSILAARHDWRLALPSADRGLELSIASVIVVLLLFARYYDVEGDRAVRSLAIGFCLFSCFAVLNDTMLERLLYDYAGLWNLLGMLAFLASLSLWTWALRKALPAAAPEQSLLPGSVYQTFVPEINFRLRLLNKLLSQFWKVEAPEP